MTAAPVEDYQKTGYCTWPALLDGSRLDALEAAVGDLIQVAAGRLEGQARHAFVAARYSDRDLLHAGLIHLYQLDPQLERYVVDAAGVSHAFHQLVNDPALHEAAAVLAGCPVSRLGAVEFFFRVDLPLTLEALEQKTLLPFHQEGSYYQSRVSRSTALVAWLPLFDCGPKEGALQVCPGSFRLGPIEHEHFCLDPVNQRHFRTRLPESVTAPFDLETLDVRRGDAAFQHFDTIHRGGRNQCRDRVRYTALVRFSDVTAPDFQL